MLVDFTHVKNQIAIKHSTCNIHDEYLFSKNAVDELFRSYLFAKAYMQEGFQGYTNDYIKSKSSTFYEELMEQYEENEDLKDYFLRNE